MSDKPEMQRNDSNSSSAISSVPLSRTTSFNTTTATTPESASRRDSSTGAGRPSISPTSISSTSSLAAAVAATTVVASNPALAAALDTAQVSSKLSTIASAAAPFIVPGSDEGHPIEPLMRIFDPSKDAGLSIEQLLARPKLPRAPSERLAMDREKARAAALVSGNVVSAVAAVKELSAEEQEMQTRLEEQAEWKKKEKELHLQNIVKMADELNAAFEKRKGQ